MTRLVGFSLVLALLAPEASAETFALRPAWSNVAEPEVLVTLPTGTRVEALSAWRPKFEAMAPEPGPYLAKTFRHQDRAALGFWAGVVGMVVSIYYYERRTPRTIGNVLWGSGWLGWFGYGAPTEGDLEDVQRALERRADGAPP